MAQFTFESITRREGGTKVPMPSGVTYHFKPTDDDPRHLAVVENQDDFVRFVAVGEALRTYRLIGRDDATDAGQDATSLGATRPASTTPAGGGEPPAGGGQSDTTPETTTQTQEPTAPAGAAATTKADIEALSDDDLFARAEQVLGKKQHPASGRDTMIAKIMAKLSEA